MSDRVQHALGSACSFLFVPGHQPERLSRALASAAHAVVVDWEDAVGPDDKAVARQHLLSVAASLHPDDRARLLVRINAAGSVWHEEDLRALSVLHASHAQTSMAAVMVPKAESPASLSAVAAVVGDHVGLLPLIESAAGLHAVHALSAVPQVLRLVFGHLDFQADLRMSCDEDEFELLPARQQLVMASRLAGLSAPVDGVTLSIRDSDLVQTHARRALRMGFGGKLCIHPAQLAPVHAAFSPNDGQLDWARRVVQGFANANGSVFSIDGRMVDAPVLALAQQILQRGARMGVSGH